MTYSDLSLDFKKFDIDPNDNLSTTVNDHFKFMVPHIEKTGAYQKVEKQQKKSFKNAFCDLNFLLFHKVVTQGCEVSKLINVKIKSRSQTKKKLQKNQKLTVVKVHFYR